ncbi:Sporangia induced myosin-like protein [Phytophthora palmivora]|uniref:Sporangia induced myosin-like protein n=1 Tax=Phytophthora palmivora TaxID=4796 RepID=A0A2P4Y5J0_9STRA|nr:Sporangia induced myosin-like protein [Phytophthora palmivora]
MGVDTLQMSDLGALPTNNQSIELDMESLSMCEQQPPDSTNYLKAVAPAPPSFNKWLADALAKEEAVSKIQLFLRYHLKLRHSANASLQGTTSTASSLGSLPTLEELDDDHRQYEILLWYGSSLGSIGFISCDITGYPCVEVAEGNDSLPGMWNLREGDFLISINERSTRRSVVPFDAVVQILDSGVRPAVLRFRRPASHELQSLTKRPRRPSATARTDRQKSRERLERSLSYVIWREEDGPLGVSLKPENGKSYPVVMAMNKSGVVGRGGKHSKVSVGDQLLTINHYDVFRLGFKKMCQVMQFAPKPLVLTFRRTSPEPVEPRSLDL